MLMVHRVDVLFDLLVVVVVVLSNVGLLRLDVAEKVALLLMEESIVTILL